MHCIERDIHLLGGIAATHELLRCGYDQRSLGAAVRDGAIIRIRKGWYGTPQLPEEQQRAFRVGGRLTCVSAAAAFGLWVPSRRRELHVAVSPNSCQLRSATDYRQPLSSDADRIVVHWTDAEPAGTRLSVSVPAAIAHVAACQDVETAFVVCESARQLRLLSAPGLRTLVRDIPAAHRGSLEHATDLSGSGTESLFAFRMRGLGIHFRQQVAIGTARVDFLIGERLVIEIDSVAHHTLEENCIRDARLSAVGYRVLRFMYSQIVNDWPSVERAVLAALIRNDHR